MHVAQYLVAQGAIVDSTDNVSFDLIKRKTKVPLHTVSFLIDVQWYFLPFFAKECVFNVILSSKEGRTALMWTCFRGHLDVAEYLVTAGANLNAEDSVWNHAIHTLLKICISCFDFVVFTVYLKRMGGRFWCAHVLVDTWTSFSTSWRKELMLTLRIMSVVTLLNFIILTSLISFVLYCYL